MRVIKYIESLKLGMQYRIGIAPTTGAYHFLLMPLSGPRPSASCQHWRLCVTRKYWTASGPIWRNHRTCLGTDGTMACHYCCPAHSSCIRMASLLRLCLLLDIKQFLRRWTAALASRVNTKQIVDVWPIRIFSF